MFTSPDSKTKQTPSRRHAVVAQSAEQRAFTPKVEGSTPSGRTMIPPSKSIPHVAPAILLASKGKTAKGGRAGGSNDDPFSTGATTSPFANDIGGGDALATVQGSSNPDDDIPF